MQGPKLLIWGLAGVILLAIAIAVTRPAASVRADIGNAELRDLAAKGARIVDVRSPGEYAIGHIAGAENVPNEQLPQTAASWDKARAVVVYCATGARSRIAAEWLAKNGFAKVYNLTQGVAQWDGQLTKDLSTAAGLVKTNGKPVLIDFYSDSWPVCIKMKPVVDRLKQQFAGKVEVRRMDANAAETQQLANAFGVEYVPTFVFVNSQGERVDEVVGEISAADLAAKMSALK